MLKMFLLPLLMVLTTTPINATLPDVNALMNPILEMIPLNGRISFNDQTFNFGNPSVGSDIPPPDQSQDIPQLGESLPSERGIGGFDTQFTTVSPSVPDFQTSFTGPQNFESRIPIPPLPITPINVRSGFPDFRANQPLVQNSRISIPNVESLITNAVPQSIQMRTNQPNEPHIPSFESLLVNTVPQTQDTSANQSVRQNINVRSPSIESVIDSVILRNTNNNQQNHSMFDSRGPTLDSLFIDIGPRAQVSLSNPTNQQNFETIESANPSFTNSFPQRSQDMSSLTSNEPMPQNFQDMSPSFGQMLADVPIQSQDVREIPKQRIPDMVTLLTKNGALPQEVRPQQPK